MSYGFVNVDQFTPNNNGWTSIGDIQSWDRQGNDFILVPAHDPSLKIYISVLSDQTFRVRFNPQPNFDPAVETSSAVVSRDLGPVQLQVDHTDPGALIIDTGRISIAVSLNPYQIKVYRQGQLIHQDQPGKNLIYIPGQEVVANLKVYPENARYCGFGEKAGSNTMKNEFRMTFFNWDNFSYATGLLPPGERNGPLNPAIPLYCSIPLLIEMNISPAGEYAGAPYFYGLFFDNPAQSYYNIGASDYSDMRGKYYFGALYGDMDYYFMAGEGVAGVLGQYTQLTGRSPMPPKYVFGFHQGAYGYFDHYRLSAAADAYRAARIPIDGLHIDVDFQDNYRTFTCSSLKFPDIKNYMDGLHNRGFKCSTNITPIMTDVPYDQSGNPLVYTQREAMLTAGCLIYDTRDNGGPSGNLYVGNVGYGQNKGVNPYTYKNARAVVYADGHMDLGTSGNYPDFGRPEVREKWGEQYAYLLQEVGMDMIWQDMTDPAIVNPPEKTFPLDLMVSNGVKYLPHAKIHNQYVLNLLMATNGGQKSLLPEKRPFIIARGGYAGMQRYAALWTGDSASTWEFLQINIPEVLNIGLSGVPISGCDIGGFALPPGASSQVINGRVIGNVTNYELFTRWMQLGAFLPWYRNHYNGYDKQFQEVFAYGEPVPTNCRKYIELRYRLLQLFYDAMYLWTQTGVPIARALFLNDAHDPAAYQSPFVDDQFFVGKDLLVAPIINQHLFDGYSTEPRRDVYLPQGSDWYSFTDNRRPLEEAVTGGTLIRGYYAGLDLVPLYVRAGAIIPTRELEQYVGELPQNPLTINIYPGQGDVYQLYLDDGLSTQAEMQSAYRLVEIRHSQTAAGKMVTLTRLADRYTPKESFFYLALLGTLTPSAVTINNHIVQDQQTPGGLENSVQGYYWNANIGITFIKVQDNNATLQIAADF